MCVRWPGKPLRVVPFQHFLLCKVWKNWNAYFCRKNKCNWRKHFIPQPDCDWLKGKAPQINMGVVQFALRRRLLSIFICVFYIFFGKESPVSARPWQSEEKKTPKATTFSVTRHVTLKRLIESTSDCKSLTGGCGITRDKPEIIGVAVVTLTPLQVVPHYTIPSLIIFLVIAPLPLPPIMFKSEKGLNCRRRLSDLICISFKHVINNKIYTGNFLSVFAPFIRLALVSRLASRLRRRRNSSQTRAGAPILVLFSVSLSKTWKVLPRRFQKNTKTIFTDSFGALVLNVASRRQEKYLRLRTNPKRFNGPLGSSSPSLLFKGSKFLVYILAAFAKIDPGRWRAARKSWASCERSAASRHCLAIGFDMLRSNDTTGTKDKEG